MPTSSFLTVANDRPVPETRTEYPIIPSLTIISAFAQYSRKGRK